MMKFLKDDKNIVLIFIVIIVSLLLISAVVYADRRSTVETDSNKNTSSQTPAEKTDTNSNNKPVPPESEGKDEFGEEDKPDITTTPYEVDVEQIGWIPSWDFAEGLKSFNNYSSDFHSISPVWYGVKEDGTLVDRRGSTSTQLLTAAKAGKVLLIPTISAFDADLMRKILDNEENLNRTIDAIVAEVVENEYDGIDIDYEEIYLTEKAEFLEMVERLADELHAQDKILSLAVLPQWGDSVIYPGLKETRQVQDWKILGQHVDQIRIMTYNFTTTASAEPGPIAPYDWMVSVVEYGLEKIPEEKIWLGVHLYGYEWNQNGGTRSYTYREALDLLKDKDSSTHFDATYFEGVASYPCPQNKSLDCNLYYQTPEGVLKRKELADKYDLAGVTYWRLGREDGLLGE